MAHRAFKMLKASPSPIQLTTEQSRIQWFLQIHRTVRYGLKRKHKTVLFDHLEFSPLFACVDKYSKRTLHIFDLQSQQTTNTTLSTNLQKHRLTNILLYDNADEQ